MSFSIIATDPFTRKIKRLSKKFKSLKNDLIPIIEELANNPTLGTPIGKDCYKIRMAITSKGKRTEEKTSSGSFLRGASLCGGLWRSKNNHLCSYRKKNSILNGYLR